MKRRTSYKFPIQWHEEVLSRRKESLEQKRIALKRLEAEIDRDNGDIVFYEYQISLAKKRNLEEFDRDRLGIKRGTK